MGGGGGGGFRFIAEQQSIEGGGEIKWRGEIKWGGGEGGSGL